MELSLRAEHEDIFKKISTTAEKQGQKALVIGGYVRDLLLERETEDIDIVCDQDGMALAEEVNKILENPIPVQHFERFGTAMIKYGTTQIEFVGARKESYRSDSRKPETSRGSLVDDQLRRDFTINAMGISLSLEDFGTLVDPFDGRHDLRQKVLRTPRDPAITFSDDPLRMMRAIRFATQLEFAIDEQTYSALKEQVDRISIISKERITEELQKIIKAKKPSTGFHLLKESGLLNHILPELENLSGVEVRKGISHKDNFLHTLEVLDGVAAQSDNVWLRWAALLHDVAKPQTKRFTGKSWTFHGHEHKGSRMVKSIFRRLRLPLNHKMRYVKKLVLLHLRPIALTKDNITDSAVRRLLFDAGDDIDDLMILCKSDITSKNERKVKTYLKNYEQLQIRLEEVQEKDRLRNWQPPVTGKDIMNSFEIAPGPVVGEIKSRIREAILDGDIHNEYEEAYQFMLDIGQELGLERKVE